MIGPVGGARKGLGTCRRRRALLVTGRDCVHNVPTMAESAGQSASYPVAYDVEPQLHDRNRLTVFFRFFLAIPHLILVGGPGLALGGGFAWKFPAHGD